MNYRCKFEKKIAKRVKSSSLQGEENGGAVEGWDRELLVFSVSLGVLLVFLNHTHTLLCKEKQHRFILRN